MVPTHERSHFLRRMAMHLKRSAQGLKIIVADSSSLLHRQANERIVADLQGHLDISYRHFECDFITKIHTALCEVETPFVTLCADDDYANFDVSQKCAEFLAGQPDYSCAMGQYLVFWTGQSKMRLANVRNVEHDSPLQRSISIGEEPFASFYSVYRTEVLEDNILYTKTHVDYNRGWAFPEEMLLHLAVLKGKLRLIDEPGYLFGVHDSNTSEIVANIADGDQARSLYHGFREALVAAICEQDGHVSTRRAKRVVDRFYRHLGRNGKRTVGEKLMREYRKVKRQVEVGVGWRTDPRVKHVPGKAEGNFRSIPWMSQAIDDMVNFPNGIVEPSSKVEAARKAG
ncbi:glycosyl transferase family protein [Rhodopirellula sallentina SM41]|uniref:Glycosyl transferase family protein n=1 Tax=Rhodopirellula sallentina SM41 TaxID=1263870 RepID=M5U2W4_9BACT|nr:glycosyl transferase family protein [Rhodopirellula sallentina SM41]